MKLDIKYIGLNLVQKLVHHKIIPKENNPFKQWNYSLIGKISNSKYKQKAK